VVILSNSPLPKKSLGQHWLNDEQILEEICSLGDITKDDLILEIGPGLGSLTKLLTDKAKAVIAIEIDSLLSSRLLARVHVENLTVINESILKYDLTKLPADYKVIANIPYYLTSNLLRLLSETSNPPSRIVLLVQKEVAERVCAKPGSMSLLSVTTQFYWEASLQLIVKAINFTPPPKVDSQVILLKRRQEFMFKDIDTKKFFRLVRVGFSARRKTLHNSLSNGFREDKGVINEILIDALIDPTTRPQMLGLEQWYEIYKVCLSKGLI
jgi:16S rRNA (adenine1518-N6/adenine1519-N6)-dimethyltransferase